MKFTFFQAKFQYISDINYLFFFTVDLFYTNHLSEITGNFRIIYESRRIACKLAIEKF